jgi:hypothetical protein
MNLKSTITDCFPNGLWADSGLSIGGPTTQRILSVAQASPPDGVEAASNFEKVRNQDRRNLGTVYGIEPNDLSQAGWAVLFSSSTPAWVRHELEPLIKRRREQSGELCKVFDGENAYKGQTCVEWLADHGVSLRAVDPKAGVPYYVLLIGSPEEIPFEFQYLLDTHFGVGRLHFAEEGDYAAYVESVLRYESSAPRVDRPFTIFATSHESDPATNLFCDKVAKQIGARYRDGAPSGFRNRPLGELFGQNASKTELYRTLSGARRSPIPALLVTGSHGMAFRDNPSIESNQGAIVCQDWPGWGTPPKREHWFGADDLPKDACFDGLVWFFFACYSGGCPDFTDFPTGRKKRERIAPRNLLSRLPTSLLSHRSGAGLAVICHVDKAWAYSFHTRGAGVQLQSFNDVFDRILDGHRIGFACDQFDYSRASLSLEFLETISAKTKGKKVGDRFLADLSIARTDARNYIVIGDPAVRIRTDFDPILLAKGGRVVK